MPALHLIVKFLCPYQNKLVLDILSQTQINDIQVHLFFSDKKSTYARIFWGTVI